MIILAAFVCVVIGLVTGQCEYRNELADIAEGF